jgi:AcrR family transcriptional regulator
MTAQEQEIRKPGRPRSAQAHESILRAALELLAGVGYRGFSMEAVAARAGVGKATIYRRWTSKDELLKEAIASLSSDFEYVDTGSLRSDFRAMLALGAGGAESAALRFVPQLLGELMRYPELHAIFRAQLIDTRREVAKQMLRAAEERGEIVAGLDLDLIVDMLVGPMIYRALRSGELDAAEMQKTAASVLEQLLTGIAPPTRGRAARSR